MDVAQFLQFLLESGTIIQNAPRVARRCPAIKSEDCGVCASTAIQKMSDRASDRTRVRSTMSSLIPYFLQSATKCDSAAAVCLS